MSYTPIRKTLFWKATPRRAEFLVISEIVTWISHWDVEIRQPRRCGGRHCYLCSVGAQKIPRMVVLALDSNNNEWLVDLRERHEITLLKMQEGGMGAVGSRICIRKEGLHSNSPVSITFLAKEYAHGRDISRLVETIGLPPLLLQERFNVDQSTSTTQNHSEVRGEAAPFSE